MQISSSLIKHDIIYCLLTLFGNVFAQQDLGNSAIHLKHEWKIY
jgi:hypothetical protein